MSFKSYVYEVSYSLAQIGGCLLSEKLPSARVITINSVVMTDYAETVESCMRVLEDMKKQCAEDRLKIICEVNPKYGGKAITKDWDDIELVRFWLHDTAAADATDSNIVAVGKAIIYGSFIGPEADA